MDPNRRQQQDQHRRGTSNNPNSPHGQQSPQQAHSPHGQQAQGYQGIDGSYAGGFLVGASQNYGRQNQQPANPPHVGQQGYINNTVGPYEGQTTSNPQGTHTGNPGGVGLNLPTLSPPLQGTPSGPGWNAGDQPTNAAVPVCKLPDCRRPRFFDNRLQELLDYCDWHVVTAAESRYVATCKRCRSMPVLGNSEYCSRICSNADRETVRQQIVPVGFAPACQECRRPIPENTEIYGGGFCSQGCWYAYHAHPSGR